MQTPCHLTVFWKPKPSTYILHTQKMQSRKLKNGKPLNCIHMYATMLLQMKRGNMHTKCMPYDYLPSAFTYHINYQV